MRANLKARIDMKKTFLKSSESEQSRYIALRNKSLTSGVNYGYYQSKIDKCDPLIIRAKAEIEALEKELESCPLDRVFKRLTGIEYRDNSR